MRRLVAIAFAMGTVIAGAQLTPDERAGIGDALFLGNYTFDDLNFSRRPVDLKGVMDLVALSLDKPIDGLEAQMALHKSTLRMGPTQALKAASHLLGGNELPAPAPPGPASSLPKDVPPEIAPVVDRLAREVSAATVAVRAAFKDLSAQELRTLIEGLPQLAVEEPSVKFEFVRAPASNRDSLLALLAKANLDVVRRAATSLSEAVDRERPTLERFGATTKWQGFLKFNIGDTTVVLAGVGDDTHRDRDARLVIDLGGNDRYYGRAGAGIGYAGLGIDVSGDDHYKVPDASTGAGLCGIGLFYDLGGFDNFRGQSLTFGSGVAGVGMLVKSGGDDSYQSETLTQGFGAWGVGILQDSRGKDLYIASLYAQGAGRTSGVGWLIDQAGDDTYRAGGLILNSPLFKDVHYSFAQGFGMGYREDTGGVAGGIGLLSDSGGDDAYIGETYAQGASYWFGLGSLGDMSGKDTYRGYHYCQASAMHATSAALIDLDGDDSYINNFGAAHAIGHDYGVAVLFDRAGADVYAGRDSRPGVGNANGLGLFVDVAGEDRYSGPPGIGNPARGSGSLGVFADLAGPDQYRDGLADDEGAARSGWGVAYDRETPRVDSGAALEGPQTPVPPVGSIPVGTPQELEAVYAKAIQWGVGSAQDEVRESVNRLIGMGLPALQWMLDNKLKSANRLSLRAFYGVVGAMGTEGKILTANKIPSEDVDVARNALMIVSELKAIEAASFIPKALERPELVRVAARAAGATKSAESVGVLSGLAASSDPRLALAAMIALSEIASPEGVGTASALLSSRELPVRKAAIAYLGKATGGYEAGLALLREDQEAKVRIGIEVLGAVGTAEALKAIAERLADGRAGVRLSALVALDGRAPAEFRQAVLDRRKDPDTRVRAVAMRIDPGR